MVSAQVCSGGFGGPGLWVGGEGSGTGQREEQICNTGSGEVGSLDFMQLGVLG